jgi:hypothetical protein
VNKPTQISKNAPEKKSKLRLRPARAMWLVNARAATQTASAKLYSLLESHPKEIKNFGVNLQLLIGISFALWRAAPYYDKTDNTEDTHRGLTKLLGEMLENNAINYSHEKESKAFTFNYYADNARLRLVALTERWETANLGPLRPPEGKRTGENRWTYLNNAFEKAVDHFEDILRADETKKTRTRQVHDH